MLDLSGTTTVYLACGVTDLRKSYHGFAAIIKLKFDLDPYSRCMFAFCNRRRTSIKILQWDGSGFWIKGNCPECGEPMKEVTAEVTKTLKFVPAYFEVLEEVVHVYSCPKCAAMKRADKPASLLKGSVATPSLVAGIMNAKYVNGMPLARQEREFARYDLNLSTKT